jgi:hypothetical protein
VSDAEPLSENRPLTYSATILLRRWITEVDVEARRLKITRAWPGFKPKTVLDCAFDDCAAVGAIEDNTEDGSTYDVYVEMKSGKRCRIPRNDNSHDAMLGFAKEISAVTGIPRRGTIYALTPSYHGIS